MGAIKNHLEGQRFGSLVVISRTTRPRTGRNSPRVAWVCQCDCGGTSVVLTENLRSGNTTTCGCSHGEHHGHARTPEYETWLGMHKRCTNKKDKSYRNYGARGIAVDPAWILFSQFYADVGPRPTKAHTLERRDNSKGYGPSNCEWATRKVQGNNRRGNHLITAFGRTQTLQLWAEEVGINQGTLRKRIVVAGWTPEDALTRAVA